MEPVLLIHGGAGDDDCFIREHETQYKLALKTALDTGYTVLEAGGTATEAVEAAVRAMEDDPLFNCSRGSALTQTGSVEMCASIMDGKTLKNGAVSIVRGVRHPVSLAAEVMNTENTGYLAGVGAKQFANEKGIECMPEGWFITDRQRCAFERSLQKKEVAHGHGTVGAVATDKHGNIAAATSTGGLSFCRSGRIADSGMIGAGTYANNETCAVSCTGDGEVIMKRVMAHAVAAEVRYTGRSLKASVDEVIHKITHEDGGDMGAIVVNTKGEFAFSFNTKRMHRGIKKGSLSETSVY